MYNQDGFFFSFPLKEASPGCPSACMGGGVSPRHRPAPPHPTRWDQGHPGKRADGECEVVSGRGELPSLTRRCRSVEGPGGARKDSPCPKLPQHPRSSSPKITHTHLPETKKQQILHSIAVSSLRTKRRTFPPPGDRDYLQLKTQGSLFPSSEQTPKAFTCAHHGPRLLFQNIKLKALSWKGEEIANDGDTLCPGTLARGTRLRQRAQLSGTITRRAAEVCCCGVVQGGTGGAGDQPGPERGHRSLPRMDRSSPARQNPTEGLVLTQHPKLLPCIHSLPSP